MATAQTGTGSTVYLFECFRLKTLLKTARSEHVVITVYGAKHRDIKTCHPFEPIYDRTDQLRRLADFLLLYDSYA